MSSKRVFSHSADINFNDYLKNKNGLEMIKNIKSKKSIPQLLTFVSYSQFILLTKAYFKYYSCPCFRVSALTDMFNSNTSFVFYQKMLSHLEDCHFCKYCNDVNQLYECKELHNVLYPYANYINTSAPDELYLHNRINLHDACNNRRCYYHLELNKLFGETTANPVDPTCNSCTKPQKHTKNNECSECYKNPTNKESFHAFPSQNTFMFQDTKEQDRHEEHLRINAYSKYPNISNCQKNTNQKGNDQKPPSNKRRSLFV